MFSLHINNLPAVVASGTAFKLTLENPTFSDLSDRTLEVTLPLAGCAENLRIFSALHHVASPLSALVERRLPFRLVTDALTLSGVAEVRAVTEEAVKVQLRSGRGRFVAEVYDKEGKERYIDTLPLGTAYDTLFARLGITTAYNEAGILREMMNGARALYEFMRYGLPFGVFNDGTGVYGGAECVCFPIFSTADNAFANPSEVATFRLRQEVASIAATATPRYSIKKGDGATTLFCETMPLKTGGDAFTGAPNRLLGGDQHVPVSAQTVFAPQPYLSVMAERILSFAYGLPLAPEDNALRFHPRLSRLFVANARGGIDYAKALPHWTVSEFITELERFCGVVVVVGGDRIRIAPRSALFASDTEDLADILFEHSAEMDAEGESLDLSTANIGYSWDGLEKVFCLGDDIWDKATVQEVDDLGSVILGDVMHDAYRRTIWIDRLTGRRAVCAEVDGRPSLVEVDQGGPLVRRSTREVDAELRIRPALMCKSDATVQTYAHLDGYRYQHTGTRTLANASVSLLTADTRNSDGVEIYDIWAHLTETTDAPAPTASQREVMEIACNVADMVATHQFSVPEAPHSAAFLPAVGVGFPFVVGSNGVTSPLVRRGSLSYTYTGRTQGTVNFADLFNLNSPQGIVGVNAIDGREVDTRTECIFQFSDHIAFDTQRVYRIAGRLFVARKFELSFSEKGLNPIKTGYFYEVN